MEYAIYKEFDCNNFDFWSGAEDDGKAIRNSSQEVRNLINNYVEAMFGDNENPPTDTDINDLFWHDGSECYKEMGLKMFKCTDNEYKLETIDECLPSCFLDTDSWTNSPYSSMNPLGTFGPLRVWCENAGLDWYDVDEAYKEFLESTGETSEPEIYKFALDYLIGYYWGNVKPSEYRMTHVLNLDLLKLVNEYEEKINDWDYIDQVYEDDFKGTYYNDIEESILVDFLTDTLTEQIEEYNEDHESDN